MSDVKALWVDTNFIIYFLRENAEFSPRVKELIDDAGKGTIVLKVNPMVISECVFVLMGRQFGATKVSIKKALTDFINLPGVQAEEKDVLEEALDNFTIKGIDFVDAYLAAHAKAVTPANVVTQNAKDFKKLGVVVELLKNKNNKED